MGVPRNASHEQIKKAYRQLAKRYHPDVSKIADAENRFKEIGEAYEILKDPTKRKAYDQLGSYRSGQSFHPPPKWKQRFSQGKDEFSSNNLGDLFAELFGQKSGFNNGIPGQNFDVCIYITIAEICTGVERNINVDIPGWSPTGNTKPAPRAVKIRIPKGACEGTKLRVKGKGGIGSKGAPNGDLIITIKIKPHALYTLTTHDISLDVPIAPWEAALGTEIELPTLSGKLRLKIKPGARSGQKLRIPGKGVLKPNGTFGDFYANLKIVLPTDLSDQEVRLFKELAQCSTFAPRSHF